MWGSCFSLGSRRGSAPSPPPPSPPRPPPPPLTHSLTPSLTHSLPHSLIFTHPLTHSLPHSLTHSLAAFRVAGAVHRASWRSCGARGRRWAAAGFCVAGAVHRASWSSCGARGRRWAAAGFTWQAQYRELPGCLSRGRRSTQSLLEELRRAWAPLGRGWLLCGRRSTQSLLKQLRRAWAPLGRGWLHVAGAVQRASWLPFAWQAQYTEPPEGAAARVGAAGPRLASRGRRSTESFLAAFRVAGAVHRASWRSCGARGRRWAAAGFTWQAQYRELPGCLLCGRRSTQSLLKELRRAWAPLGRWAAAGFTWQARLPFAWHTQYTELPEEAAARVGAAGPRLTSGAVQRASWLPFVWQAQYTEPPGGAAAREGAAGPRLASRGGAVQRASWLPSAWQAQYTEPPGGAAARVGAAGPRLAFVWQAQHQELRRAWAPLGRWAAAGFTWQAQYRELPCCLSRGRRRRCGARGRRWAGFTWQAQYRELPGCLSCGRRSTQSLLEKLRRAWAPLGRGWLLCGTRNTEPPEGAAARVGAGGPRLASRGRRSTQSLLKGALQRVSWLLRVGAEHRASWRSCGARVHSATFSHIWLIISFHNSFTSSPVPGTLYTARNDDAWTCAASLEKELVCCMYHVPGSCFSLGSRRSCSRLRRRRLIITTHHRSTYHITTSHHNLSHTNSSQLHFSHLTHHSSTGHHNSSQLHFSQVHFSSQLITSQLITAPLLTPHSSQLHCSSPLITTHHNSSQLITAPLLTGPLLITTHHNLSHPNSSQLHFWQVHFSSQLITTYHIPTHHSSNSHTSLLTAHLSHHNFSSQLITTYPITAPLLTPHLSHQNSSQLHFSHLTSQVHFSHLTSHTSPKFTLKSYIHKGLTCGVIRSFYF